VRALPDIWRVTKRVVRTVLVFMGTLALLLVALSFTDIPYWAYHRLGLPEQRLSGDPDLVVVLGGAGMPSPDGLIRTYYAAGAARQFPAAGIIIALPYSGRDSLLPLQLMANELILKGVDPQRIRFEPHGFNTHAQAVNIAAMAGEQRSALRLLVVTSPEHMFRAVRCFENEGFSEVGGEPAFEVPVEEDKLRDKKQPGGLGNVAIRYNVWSYMHYELLVLREYCAISYYKLRGWL